MDQRPVLHMLAKKVVNMLVVNIPAQHKLAVLEQASLIQANQ